MPGRDNQREDEQASAACHPHRSRQPDGRGGRESAHAVTSYENQATADEANARDDLGCNTRRVEDDLIGQ